MNKRVAIIVGGTGQFGITVAKLLLKRNYKVIITSRNPEKKINLKNKNLKIKKLDIHNKDEIKIIIKKNSPKLIFFFAGQSSPAKSFTLKNETYKSNFLGCKAFLEVIKIEKIDCKFLNAASSEMFGKINGKIKINSKKNPINPYGYAKLKAFEITKKYRLRNNLKTYNAIIFNTESYLRKKNYLIPKICMAAINAKKYGTKTQFGNIDMSREWNWCDEQSIYLLKFLNKKPQDFILSNGKNYSITQMLKYAFNYFSLDYLKYVSSHKKYFRKKDITHKNSSYETCLKRNKMKREVSIYGKKIIQLMIKNFIKQKKY